VTVAQSFTVVGAGLAGTLMATLLAQRGHRVELLERRADPRRAATERGRSINLALAARGLHALELAGLRAEVDALLIPVQGRMLHELSGAQSLIPYGQGPHEVIYSVSRSGLNELLLDAAERVPELTITFDAAVVGVDFERGELRVSGERRRPLHHVIAADGAGSVVRRAMVDAGITACDIDMLTHGYKELTIAPRAGVHAMQPNALHIWPRGGFMLIALPNTDGSFTVTLFLAREGWPSFSQLTSPEAVNAFFATHFSDAAALMPDLAREFFAHPVGEMGTVRTARWAVEDQLLLIGDAAHAIVPFHGQGMNCALEDCVQLVRLLEQHETVHDAFAHFQSERRVQANAIADMALENYVEMRDTVRDPTFQLQKGLSLELERRHPGRFVPRYSMVMFRHEIPYATAYERGRIQSDILRELTQHARSIDQIDFTLAARLINERLLPLTYG
jgi:kynurenine 3-monooxygenase